MAHILCDPMITLPNDLPPRLMAIGAHADDIEINVGGTFEKSFRCGYEITYVMSTNNMSGMVSTLSPDGKKITVKEPCTKIIHRRKRECAEAAKEWNTTPIHLDHPQRHYTVTPSGITQTSNSNRSTCDMEPRSPVA